MTRILVTGAGGFIGRHVMAALDRLGLEGVAMGRTPALGETRYLQADLFDTHSMQRAVYAAEASHLLHLAWITEPGVYWRSPANLAWRNATLDLMRAFREAKGSRVLVAGSCAEYEWGAPYFRERDTPCRPATPYGLAKDETRRLGEAFANESGLSFTWARVFFTYGPGDRPGRLVPDAMAALAERRPFPTSHGRQRRDFLHVGDVADGLVALAASSVTGPVNIASGRAVGVRVLLEALAAEMGGRECLDFGARSLGESEPAVIEGDHTRLRDEVGFTPRFGLVDGLRDTVRAFLEECPRIS